MIPSHILDNLGPDDRVAVFSRRRGGLRFLVHGAADASADIRTNATQVGDELLASHLHDPAAILELVAGREWDIGGEA